MTATVTLAGTAAARAVNVTKRYGEGDAAVVALDDVTASLRTGVFTAIMGPSGSGKSTLLHILAGLDRPTSGRVFLGDTDITELTDHDLTLLRRNKVGFIFQAFNLLPTLTAKENIVLPIRIGGRKPDPAWIEQLVKTVGLSDRLPPPPPPPPPRALGPARPPARRAVRWPAATRRGCPRAGDVPAGGLRRRADGCARLAFQR